MKANKDSRNFNELPTLEEFSKEIPETIKKLYVHNRLGTLVNRYPKDIAIQMFRYFKVFNFFNKEEGVMDIYIGF